MKTNYLLLSAFFLFFLFGCKDIASDVETEIPEEIPDVEITSPDNSGKEIVGIPDFTVPSFFIEYLDKEKKGYLLLEGEELIARQNDLMDIETLSFTDEITGLSFAEPGKRKAMRNMIGYGPEIFEYYDVETIRHYVFKYKIPSIKGESVEEIKAIFHFFGFWGGKFTEVWYNGKAIPMMDRVEINERFPPEGSDDRYDRDVYERIMKETYYCGDLVAVTNGWRIYIMIPIP